MLKVIQWALSNEHLNNESKRFKQDRIPFVNPDKIRNVNEFKDICRTP